jgi:phosphohistidine phosphatase
VGSLRLTLLRHGQAESVDSRPEDFERVLTRRGVHEAEEMASRLLRRDLIPDLILVSPAERAWATAAIVAAACELDAKQVQCARELYLGTAETTWGLLSRPDWTWQHVLVCGHNPGLSELASRFGPHPTGRDLPTAGLVTAVWHDAAWATIQPETAASCDFDDPETMAELFP